MTIETYEDIPNATDDEVMKFLREQIHIILEASDNKKKILVSAFDEILKDIKRRLDGVKNE